MALPYLEDYVTKSKKVRREDLYELSYSYYQANQLNKAIEGFKQLSGKDDSLSQHSMYLLGDAYLKTGQKSNFFFVPPTAVILPNGRFPGSSMPNFLMN